MNVSFQRGSEWTRGARPVPRYSIRVSTNRRNLNTSSATRLAWFVVAVAVLWSGRVYAVSPATTAVGVYDETVTQFNNVDFNATGNAHSASTGDGATYSTPGSFNPLVAGAFALGHGGVIRMAIIVFRLPPASRPEFLPISPGRSILLRKR